MYDTKSTLVKTDIENMIIFNILFVL